VEVTKPSKPSRKMGRIGDPASKQAVTRVNVEQSSKSLMGRPTMTLGWEGRRGRRKEGVLEETALTSDRSRPLPRGSDDGMFAYGDPTQHGKPRRWRRVPANRQPARARPGRAGVADRLVVPLKPGNAGGGKGPEFSNQRRGSREPGRVA
jgi:hypothetical protein